MGTEYEGREVDGLYWSEQYMRLRTRAHQDIAFVYHQTQTDADHYPAGVGWTSANWFAYSLSRPLRLEESK